MLVKKALRLMSLIVGLALKTQLILDEGLNKAQAVIIVTEHSDLIEELNQKS